MMAEPASPETMQQLRQIVVQATQHCRDAGVKAEPLELAYMATLLQQQQQQQQPTPQAPASSSQVAAAVAEGFLRPQDGGWQATVRLQIAMERAYHQQQQRHAERQADEQRRVRAAAAAVLALRPSAAGSTDEYEAAAERLLDYLAAAGAQMGEGAAQRAELATALESVCGLTGVARLLTLAPAERQQQIEALVPLVTGVVLFNASRGALAPPTALRPGGAAAADLKQAAAARLLGASSALQHAAALLRSMQQAAQDVRAAHAWLSSVSAAVATARTSRARATPGSSVSAPGQEPPLPSGGAILYCIQVWSYLAAMAADMEGGLVLAQRLDQQLAAGLAEVEGLVAGAAAVRRDAAFPLLEALGATHAALRGELALLLQRRRLWAALQDAAAAAAAAPGAASAGVVCPLGFAPPTGTSSLVAAALQPQAPAAASILASLPQGLRHVARLPGAAPAAAAGAGPGAGTSPDDPGAEQQVALGGLCPVSLWRFVGACAAAPGGGAGRDALAALQLADPAVGGISVDGRLYGLSSPAALAAFVANHQQVLAAAAQQAPAVQPLLQLILRLQQAPAPAAAEGSAQDAGAGTAPAGGTSGAGGPATAAAAAAASSGAGAGLSDAPPNAAASEASEDSPGSPTAAAAAGADGRAPTLRQLLLGLQHLLLRVEAGTQTPTHFVEKHIDYSYEWNEWALRKRVLALANLKDKATHGSQTASSHFRREGATQVWLPKPAVTQTPVNKGSTMPRPLRYVAGLRGAPGAQMKVLTLQLDLGQPHQL